jgi:hypothetical protein
MRLQLLCCLITVGALLAQSDTPEGMKERRNLRDARYCEILIVLRHGMSATAAVYNTIGLNDCPAQQWQAVDPEKLKKERKAYMVVMNGPRHFMMDRNALRNPGPVETLDGLQFRLLAHVEMHAGASKRVPYTETTVDRETQYVYEAGKNVYEILSPAGQTYIMQSYSQEIDKSLEEASLPGLATRLKLPKGWLFRVRKPTEELIVRNAGTKAYVLQDDLQNSYQRIQ